MDDQKVEGEPKKEKKREKKKQKGTGSTVDQPRRTCFPKPIGPGRSEIKSRMLHTAPASILRCQLRDGKGGKKGRTFWRVVVEVVRGG